MRKEASFALGLCLMLCLSGCGSAERQKDQESTKPAEAAQSSQAMTSIDVTLYEAAQVDGASFTTDTKIEDVINDPAFEEYGRLIFPVNSSYYSGSTLGDLRLTWYNNIDPSETVEIVN